MIKLERALRCLLRVSGVRSRYVETEVARHHVYDAPGRGALPAIVFLPGLSDSAATIVPMLPRVRAWARRVVIVEGAGHGLSGPARGEYSVTRHLASTIAVLDALLDEPAILVGNSLGGATALRYAHVRPDRVCGLYLTSPGGAPFEPDAAELVRRAFTMRTSADARAFIELVFHRSPRLAPLLAPLLFARATSPAVAGIVRTLEHECAPPAELEGLTMPVTLLWGRSERLLPASALSYFRAHLPAHAAIVEPEGFGHCPHLDDPARLARLLDAFARSVPSRDDLTPTGRRLAS